MIPGITLDNSVGRFAYILATWIIWYWESHLEMDLLSGAL